MLNNEKIIKLRKRKALLEIQKKFYWFPVVKKNILDIGITRNPDEYMYDILWGVRLRNEYIRGTAQVGRFGDKVREARLRWFWTCAQEGSGVYREKDAEDGATR